MGSLAFRIPWHEFLPPAVWKIADRIPWGRRTRHPFGELCLSRTVEHVVDVGANVGRVAEAALRSFPSATVFCFEPVTKTYQQLLTRLAPYGDRVRARQVALSDVNGESLIHLTSFHGANSLHPQSQAHKRNNPHVFETSREIIKLARLDDLAEELPSRIDIMKIDVEGHELNVLRGGSAFLRERVDSLIIEVSLMRDPSWHDQAVFDIFAHMKSLDFCLVNIFDLHRSRRGNMRLVQMDCVFQKRAVLETYETA